MRTQNETQHMTFGKIEMQKNHLKLTWMFHFCMTFTQMNSQRASEVIFIKKFQKTERNKMWQRGRYGGNRAGRRRWGGGVAWGWGGGDRAGDAGRLDAGRRLGERCRRTAGQRCRQGGGRGQGLVGEVRRHARNEEWEVSVCVSCRKKKAMDA